MWRYGLPAVVNAEKLPIGTMRVWRDVLASKKSIGAVKGAVGLSARERGRVAAEFGTRITFWPSIYVSDLVYLLVSLLTR